MKLIGLRRIRLFSFFIFAFAILLVGRLYSVQIVSGEIYEAKADKQYVRVSTNRFDRGSIFFRDKKGNTVSAATVKQGHLLFLNPTLIDDPHALYAALREFVPLDETSFIEKASRKDSTYKEIAHKLDEETVKKITALDLPGVQFARERWRYYPGESLAAHAIGFTAFQGDVRAGRYGLERYYEDMLHREGGMQDVNFFAELFANIQKRVLQSGPREADLVTSLEPTVQAFLENELKKVNSLWSSEHTGGIIMDPKTGEIIAMAIAPDFNLNSFGSAESVAIFSNPLVENVYEMGSIIKPLTIAAGIDAGAITPKTTYYDHGFVEVDGAKISNYDGIGRGEVDMQAVLSKSLNTGVAFVVGAMGKENFAEYMLNFDFGQETGIDLPNETRGLVENLRSPRTIEHITSSYGQGIAMTPIATVRALSALANGGLLVHPHLVTAFDYHVGGMREASPLNSVRVLKPETAEEVTRMLVEVVDNALANGTAKNPRYSIAAKTGTAQIAKSDDRGYYTDRFLHSFFGYFPAYDPEFLVFFYTVYPKGVDYASETLTTSFLDTSKFLINYYEIAPDR